MSVDPWDIDPSQRSIIPVEPRTVAPSSTTEDPAMPTPQPAQPLDAEHQPRPITDDAALYTPEDRQRIIVAEVGDVVTAFMRDPATAGADLVAKLPELGRAVLSVALPGGYPWYIDLALRAASTIGSFFLARAVKSHTRRIGA